MAAIIIPSINVPTFIEVQERIKRIEPYVQWCHFDVTDGLFSIHETWRNPADLSSLKTSLKAEVHLMVQNPENVLDKWLVNPIQRIIVHLEAACPVRSPIPEVSADAIGHLTSNGMNPMDLIIEKCHGADVEIGLAINPETPWEKLEPWLDKVDMVQVLTVHPGPSGQEVNWPEMLQKVMHIRKSCPLCTIEVDGGVNPHTYKEAVLAGTNILVSGNFIFNSPDIKSAIEMLRQ